MIFLTTTIWSSCQGMVVQPIPRHHVDSLSIEEFDSIYLDRMPLIVQGSTACPAEVDLSSIHDYCRGDIHIPGSLIHTKTKNGSEWAGLKAGSRNETVDFGDFVRSMGSSDKLRFIFDLPMVEICPKLPQHIRIPRQFVNIFSSHFQYRHLASAYQEGSPEWKRLCPKLPFFNMYLAEQGFETDLHVDAMHSSFVASMCDGRKRWRVMSTSDFARAYESIGEGGLNINGTWVMSSIQRPFDTWSPESMLEDLDVTIYEGILEPGEILYIPAGAPHAAITLDQSLMVASNDRTIFSLREFIAFCERLPQHNGMDHYGTFLASCRELHRNSPTIERNQAIFSSASEREKDATLATAMYCENTFALLNDVPSFNQEEREDGVLYITPQNFGVELAKGPMVVMKCQNSAGVCLHFLKHWRDLIRDFEPPVQFGILACIFQNECILGDDPIYDELVVHAESLPTPAFLYVQRSKSPKEESKLRFSHYYGFLGMNELRVWMSVQTGAAITGGAAMSRSARILWTLFHTLGKHLEELMKAIGPTLFGIFVAIFFLALFMGIAYIWEVVMEHLRLLVRSALGLKSRSSCERTQRRKTKDL